MRAEMDIIVLGASGMLGHKVFQTLVQRFPSTRGTLRAEPDGLVRAFVDAYGAGSFDMVDVTDTEGLARYLHEHRPDVVVNCVGVIKQLDAASRPIPSILINSLLPHRLAEWSSDWGGRLVHFSTDCVFTGSRGGYLESDVPDAVDLYGRTKQLGEVTEGRALTLRTSIIGRELRGFRSLLEWFRGEAGGSVQGFSGAIFSGVTTNFLAEVVADVLVEDPSLSGLFHVSAEPISKLHLLERLNEALGLGIRIEPSDTFQCDRSLRGEAFAARFGPTPSWDQLIEGLVQDPTPYDDWNLP